MNAYTRPASRFAVAAGLIAVALVARTASADAEIYQTTLTSTVWVLAKSSEGTSSGTGVLIDADRKLVITNAHVVGDCRNAVLFFADMENGRPKVDRQHYYDNVKKLGLRGRIVAVDRKRDLALIEIDRIPEGAKPAILAPTSALPGEAVNSVGNPGASEALWVFTSGTVRSVYKKTFRSGAGEHEFTVLETQAPINSGDSGGPVVNAKGELVAVAQAISPKARLVTYCVDISEVRDFLDSPWKPAPLPVEEVLKSTDLTYTKHETGHFEVKLTPETDQTVSVFIAKDVEYFERADVRRIWTLAQVTKEAPTSDTMTKLLEQSARTKIGAWSIERNPAGEWLIVYCVKMDATAAPDAVKSTMNYVGKLSVAMKKELAPEAKTTSSTETLNAWLAN
jgi:hypothetical protein